MKKHKASLLLISTVLILACIGCAAFPQKPEMTTVVVWSSSGHNKDFLIEQVKKWNKTEGKEKGIKIDFQYRPDNFYDMITLAMINGTAPDLVTGVDMTVMAENDLIASIDEFEGGQEMIEEYSEYIDPSRHMVNGKVYTIPTSTSAYGIIYNVDMFKAAGIVDSEGNPTPPKTYSEYIEYAKRLTNPEKGEYGIIFPGGWSEWTNVDVAKLCVASCGFISGYNPKTGLFDYSGEADAIKTLMQIKRDGSYYPDMTLDNDEARVRFAQGKIGMKTAGYYDYGVLTNQFATTIHWAVAPYPVKDGVEPMRQHMDSSGQFFINKKSVKEKNADKIFEVFKFFSSDELMIERYKHGVELPLKLDLIENVELDDSLPYKENWQAFADIVKISQTSPKGRLCKYDESKRLSITDAWERDLSDEEIDQIAIEWAKTKNEGVIAYQNEHPEYDPSDSIVPTWDASR